ncbi:TetR/AcrR family transcriptional regulator [Roseovarius sp. CAU 1744]|uniref:TetR/AcrR family transcriptional regulator n=1 Tax=Roseovarius sp. CAU 1744 TaxID=3140368 RepID=UPI00325C2AEA
MTSKDEPRAAYIAIAAKKFSAAGYHGTSLAAVAQEAGVTKQALLHFFGTKERLYAEVLTDLAMRQCAEIDAAERPAPADHLLAYFTRFRTSVLSQPDDARLVVRALLDSHEDARTWPMKPYLDKLVELARRTPRGQAAPVDEVRAWVFQMIGAIQYLAISSSAILGMYGKGATDAVVARFEDIVAAAVGGFTSSRVSLAKQDQHS